MISIDLISGSQIPKKSKDREIVDPFVTIDFISTSDSPLVTNQPSFTSKVIENNGFNPVWNEEVCYHFIKHEINILVIKVWDEDPSAKSLLCWNAIDISTIRKGYRVVEMKDMTLKPNKCKLLFKFSFDDYGQT